MPKRGFFISFEGGEGGGKSTQIKRLKAVFKRNRIPFLVTLEPGGTPIGRKIRELLLNPKNKRLSIRAELYLYEADRAQHVDKVLELQNRSKFRSRELLALDTRLDRQKRSQHSDR